MIARQFREAFLTLVAVVVASPVFAAPPDGERKLELVVQKGHSGRLTSVSHSPDGKWIVTTAWDSTAIIWDAATGDQLRVLAGHKNGVLSARFSPDGKRIVTASADGTAIVWEAVTGKSLLTVKGHEFGVSSASFSPDGKRILTSTDKTADIWDADTGKSLAILKGHNETVEVAAFSPDGKRVVTGSWDRSAKVWEAETGKELMQIPGHQYPVKSASFSPDGKRIITAYLDKMAYVWDAESWKQNFQLVDADHNVVLSACFSPDAAKAVTRNHKATTIWNLTTGKKILAIANENESQDDGEVCPSVSPDGKQVAVVDGMKVTVCNTETGARLRVIGGASGRSFTGMLIGDERKLLGFDNGAAVVWNLNLGEKLLAFGQADPIEKPAVSQDGKRMVSKAAGNQASVWDLDTGKIVHRLKGHAGVINELKFSPDGKRIVTASEDKRAIIWDAETGTVLHRLEGHEEPVDHVDFSPDGGKVLTRPRDYSLSVWDTATGKRLCTRPKGTSAVISARFLPDGKRIIADLSGEYQCPVIIMDAGTGKTLHALNDPGRFCRFAGTSEDGKRIVTASDHDGIVWNADSGGKLLTLKGHTAQMWDAGYSPDGKKLVTTSDDGTAIVWDAASGEKLRTLQGHTSRVYSAGFSRDGKRIVTTAGDGTVRFWNAETGLELGALVSLNTGRDWLVATPDGYFDGSENGARFIGLRGAGTNDLVPLESYRKQFEHAGLLGKIWEGRDYRGVRPVARDLPPKVRITSPATGFESKDGKLTVEAEAISQGENPVELFILLVNGRPLGDKRSVAEVADPKPGKATAKWEIDLEPGRHTIAVLAQTRAVYAKSDPVEVKYVGGNASGVELPTLYILSVGVSKYPVQPLDFAHRDAEEIAKAFQANSKTLFKKIETKVLTDEKATKDNVLDGLDWLRKNMTQKDFGIFFFAGHGVKDSRDTVYFMPVDGNREKLTRTAIDGDVLSKELTSTVGQLLVILDACHAGAVGGNKSRGLSDNLLKDLSSEEKGIAIMCSASGREEAGESREHQHGKFTVALLEGLRGKGDGKDTKIGLTDGAVYFKKLDSYVTDRVKVLSKGEQHPVTCIPRNFRDFPLSKP